MKIRILRAAVSEGCNALTEKLKEAGHDVKKIRIPTSSYRGYPTHLIINWGRSDRDNIREILPILNDPDAVKVACNKLSTLLVLDRDGLSGFIPKWTTDKREAMTFIQRDCTQVYCRGLLRASEGRGIVVANSVEDLIDAELYTAKVDNKREVRIHIFKGQVIDFSQKKKMSSARLQESGISEVDLMVRSHSNGWVFARDGVTIPDEAGEVAAKAVSALGLDFGAVDLIITSQGRPIILEVNTAPGLEGTTVESYSRAILDHIAVLEGVEEVMHE